MSIGHRNSYQVNKQIQMAAYNKSKIAVPPTRYVLSKLTQFEALTQIGNLTRGFSDLPFDLAQWINYDVRNRQFTSFGYIPAPSNVEQVKQIIGIDGYYFKLTTQKCGIDFIWHDRTTNEFHFWGEHYSCIRAMNAIRYRICKIVENSKPKEDGHAEKEEVHVTDGILRSLSTLNISENNERRLSTGCLETIVEDVVS